MRKTDRDNRTDVFIVHTDSEWQLAKKIAQLLEEYGYGVAQSGTRAQAGEEPVETLPSNASAVLVIWPVTRAIFDMPAFEARAAALDGRLVQIYAGSARPDETYAGASPLDFVGWDLTATGARWHGLMRRLRKLCGPPPKRPLDVVATTQSLVLYSTLVLAVGSIAAVFLELGHKDAQQATAPAAPIGSSVTEEAMRSTIVVAPRAVRALRDEDAEAERAAGLGGPEAYEKDLGVDEVVLAPVLEQPAPPPAPEPVRRAPQNPPSALE